jgi:hypothetical protein
LEKRLQLIRNALQVGTKLPQPERGPLPDEKLPPLLELDRLRLREEPLHREQRSLQNEILELHVKRELLHMDILDLHLKELFLQMEMLEDHLKEEFLQMDILDLQLKELFLRMEILELQLKEEPLQMEKVFLQLGKDPLQMIGELDQLGQGRHRLERGFLMVAVLLEVMVKLIYLIARIFDLFIWGANSYAKVYERLLKRNIKQLRRQEWNSFGL